MSENDDPDDMHQSREDPDAVTFETDYELGQDNIRPFGLDIHNPVFVVSGGAVFLFVVVALLNQEASAELLPDDRPVSAPRGDHW